jgi:hypothetical protein
MTRPALPSTRMRLPLLALPALALVLGGCSEGVYYDTRYIPTDVESTYSLSAQLSWHGDREVYELPAAAPDIDNEQKPRVRCTYPYQKFKPQTIAGMGLDQVHSSTDIGEVAYGGYDDRIHPTGPTVPLHQAPNFATDGRPYNTGAPLPQYNPRVAGYDERPHSNTSIITIEPIPTTGWNSNANPYCCGDAPDNAQRTPSAAPPLAPVK